MVQIPAARNEAVEPVIEQMAGAAEVKLTGNPELAVATKTTNELAACAGIAPKVIVCCVLPVPMPRNWMLC